MAELTPIQIGKLYASKKFIELITEGAKFEKVPEEEQQRRIEICEGCDRFDSKHRACTECACPMDYKTSLLHDPIRTIKDKFKNNKEVGGAKTECPLKKW